MSVEGQIKQRIRNEDYRGLTIVAHPHHMLKWERGLGAAATHNFVIINDTFWKLDQDAATFFIRHEIGHINNSSWESGSYALLRVFQCVAPILGTGFVYRSSHSLPLTAIGAAISSIFSYCFSDIGKGFVSRQHEYWADTYAIKTSTNAELKGGLRGIEAASQAHCLIWGSEDWSWTSSHPTLSSRINRFKNELINRGEDVDWTEYDQQKIQDMMCWEVRDSSLKIPSDKQPLFEDFDLRLKKLNNS